MTRLISVGFWLTLGAVFAVSVVLLILFAYSPIADRVRAWREEREENEEAVEHELRQEREIRQRAVRDFLER